MSKLLAVVLVLFAAGMYLRFDKWFDRFYYSHDSDLAAWIFKDIVIDRHPRLIGQETSSQGLFIGPLFYYQLIPFYWLTRLSPLGTVAYGWIIGTLSLASLWYVARALYSAKAAVATLLVYALSQSIAAAEREVVPTTPVFLWSIWFFYALHLVKRRHFFGLPLAALLLALAWNIQASLLLLFPLVIMAQLASRALPATKSLLISLVLGLLVSAPLILFEVKHDFIQIRSTAASFAKPANIQRTLFQKANAVANYSLKNANWVFWQRPTSVPTLFLPTLVAISGTLALLRARLFFSLGTILGWFALFGIFFVLHPITLSEYYLNSLNILWALLAGFSLSHVISLSKTGVYLGILLSLLYLFHNFYRHWTLVPNASGFRQRQDLVSAINVDALAHGFPCFSVSYMTDPGNNFGYRYLFWLQKSHLVPISPSAPVYTIVFPHPRANRLDMTFGALGLVFPQYDRYTKAGLDRACSGQNSNLTDPMFGFTK